MGVVNEGVLNVFSTMRREEFVPEDKKSVAYVDEDLPLGRGRFLIEPLTQARLVQALSPKSDETALDIGGATGYTAAILSKLCSSVCALETDSILLAEAEKNWAKLGYGNIVPHNGPHAGGFAQMSPYNVILINGAVADVSQALFDQLAVGGRMAAVVKAASDKIGRATLFTKNAQGHIERRVLFDAAIPYLTGFEPRNEFVF
jgi:protein-L-isoaspartate(D-aspartate) O-methyltransferase